MILRLAALFIATILGSTASAPIDASAQSVLDRFRSGDGQAAGMDVPMDGIGLDLPVESGLLQAADPVLEYSSDPLEGLAVPVSEPVGDERPAQISLISAVTGTGDLDVLPLGVKVTLQAGWKTYWRTPGAAGLPPRLDLSGSENVSGTDLLYPAPVRFSLFDIDTFGYADEVIYPLDVAVAEPGAETRIQAVVDLLVCSDLCIPVRETVGLDLPSGPAAPNDDVAQTLDRFRAQVPGAGRDAGLTLEGSAWVDGALQVAVSNLSAFSDPDLLVEAGEDWFFGPPEWRFSDGLTHATATLPAVTMPQSASLIGEPVALTLIDQGLAAELQASPTGVPLEGMGGHSLWLILGLAVLGGLILNVMPCVLPVLSLKLFGLVQDGGKAPAEARIGLLVTALGILTSFLALAAGALALKAAGGAVGWGIQFQQPLFLIFMISLLVLFAANMMGWFEILLPGSVNDAAYQAGNKSGLLGHFGTGAFATLLATPCSAPFLGTAVGFALSRGPVEIISVFTALGIGFALPYLLIAALPGAVKVLPKPGRWMGRVKQVLALALIGTALWLLSVLMITSGLPAALVVAAAMAVVLLGLALRPQVSAGRARAALTAVPVAVVAAFLAPSLLPTSATSAATDADWEIWSRQAVADRITAGDTVLVDVTAEWCLTCIANKRLVLDREPVAPMLSTDIVALRADWTRPDPEISAFLADHGRYGIPFNIVYGPEAPDGIVLPELLTTDAVMNAIEQASGGERNSQLARQ